MKKYPVLVAHLANTCTTYKSGFTSGLRLLSYVLDLSLSALHCLSKLSTKGTKVKNMNAKRKVCIVNKEEVDMTAQVYFAFH